MAQGPGTARSGRERTRASDRLKWSILASGWVHVGLGFILLFAAWATPDDPDLPHPDRITLVRLDASGIASNPDPLAEPVESALERFVEADPYASRALDIPAPEPVPPEPVEQPDVEYVRVDRPGAPPTWSARISSHDASAIEETRALVTAREHGPRTLRQQGAQRRSAPALPRRSQDAQHPTPAETTDPVKSGDRSTEQAAAGGRRTDGTATGASGQGGEHSEGGPAARRAAGSALPDQQTSYAGAGGQEGFRPGRDGQHAAQVDRTGQALAPAADAGMGSPADPSTARDSTDHAAPTDGDGLAMSDSPGADVRKGGHPDASDSRPAPRGHRGSSDAGDSDADSAAPFDPISDLQAFMGWERPEYSESQGSLDGTADDAGSEQTSPQTAVADIVRDYVDVSARQDPLGVYMRRVEDLLNERWMENDLSVMDKAKGIQGDVVVRYVIEANGRVADVHIARHSGHVELDLLALAAIPARVPRIPRELQRERIHHQVTLRYRNPFILTAGTR